MICDEDDGHDDGNGNDDVDADAASGCDGRDDGDGDGNCDGEGHGHGFVITVVPRFYWECAKNITRALGVSETDSKWFLSTDSERVKTYAIENFGDKIITTNGTITHIELTPQYVVNTDGNGILFEYNLLDSVS